MLLARRQAALPLPVLCLDPVAYTRSAPPPLPSPLLLILAASTLPSHSLLSLPPSYSLLPPPPRVCLPGQQPQADSDEVPEEFLDPLTCDIMTGEAQFRSLSLSQAQIAMQKTEVERL